MPGDYGYWVQDMSPNHRGPTTVGTLVLLAVVALVLLALFRWPAATADGGLRGHVSPPPASTVPACARHWPPTCQEPAGGR
jgi:hypothetical protein